MMGATFSQLVRPDWKLSHIRLGRIELWLVHILLAREPFKWSIRKLQFVQVSSSWVVRCHSFQYFSPPLIRTVRRFPIFSSPFIRTVQLFETLLPSPLFVRNDSLQHGLDSWFVRNSFQHFQSNAEVGVQFLRKILCGSGAPHGSRFTTLRARASPFAN